MGVVWFGVGDLLKDNYQRSGLDVDCGWRPYHDICVFDVRRAGVDVAMRLRELLRLFKVFALVFFNFACAWDFGAWVGVYVHFVPHCGELLRAG